MCGFVGIADIEAKRPIDGQILRCMNESQHHRGPDERGEYLRDGIGLGHTRLSIIDLASGQQPLFNEDGSVVVVYNGEIYNHLSIRKELVASGHQFKTNSDTEVIVHAWEEWGERCVERFNGMFAFAIWDSNSDTLFLARDRIGIKPLYYAVSPSGFMVFGSELKSLLVHPDLPRDLDVEAIEDYFAFGYVPDPRTIYSGVHKLEPGHTLCARRGCRPGHARRYWDVPFANGSTNGNASFESAKEELLERLGSSVSRRLMSEVPLGAFLSGGVDSSAVVALMARQSESSVNTCSISFGDRQYNEAAYAQSVAEQYHTNHNVEQVLHDDYDLIDTLASHYDEPFADSSALPTYRVCQLARKHVTVALSGDGGDENFAGYRRYRWHAYEEKVRSRLPQGIRGPLFGFLGRYYPKLDWAPKVLRAKTTFQALARDSLAGFQESVSVVSRANRSWLFSDDFKQSLGGYDAVEVFRRHAAVAPSLDPLSLVQYLDFKTYLPGDILTKVDRASMAHSLEVRVPLLDHTFTEWVSGLDPAWKLRGRNGKHILKEALRDILPDDILFRPKMGFAVPIGNWFRGPLKDRISELSQSSTLIDTGILDRDAVSTMISRHQSGVSEHSAAIWALVMFEASLRHLGGTPRVRHHGGRLQ